MGDLITELPRPITEPTLPEHTIIPKEPTPTLNNTEQQPINSIGIAQSEIPQTPKPSQQEKTKPIALGASQFLPKICTLLEHCGINPATVNPTPIGEGANHIVFWGTSKEGEQFVVKIPKSQSKFTMNNGHEDEQVQIDKIQKAFPGYSLPTKVCIDKETNQYVVVQKAVKGKPMNNHITDPALLSQLHEIIELNNTLHEQYDESLDFVGMPGFVSWVKRQFGKLLLRKSDFEVSNLLIDEETNHLYIIDTDVLRTKNVPFRTALISRIGLFFNRIFMKHYFGKDIKKRE